MEDEGQDQPPESILNRDPIWESFLYNSFDYFQHLVEGMSFHSGVDEDVVKRFEPVKKAVLYSYFEYQLLEPAYDRALLAFEMALRRRYRERHPEAERLDREAPDEPYNLQQLIDWAEEEHLFEDIEQRATPGKDDRDEEHVAHSLRYQRNRAAHPQRHDQLGILALQGIRRVIDTINHLYEEPEPRRKRHERLQEARQQLNTAFDGSAVLGAPAEPFPDVEERPRFLIFRAAALHCEDHHGDLITHFAFQPIFNPDDGPEDGFSKPDPIVVPASSHSAAEDSLHLEDTEGRRWTLSPLRKEENKEALSNWQDEMGDDYEIAHDVTKIEFGRIRTRLRSPEG